MYAAEFELDDNDIIFNKLGNHLSNSGYAVGNADSIYGPTEGVLPIYTDDVIGAYTVVYQPDGSFAANNLLNIVYLSGNSINEQLSSEVSAYPNPARNVVFVQCPAETNVNNIQLLDMLGKVVLEVASPNMSDGVAQIDLTNVSTGRYFILLNTTNGNAIKQIVVK
jgi:hypothetical protein